MCLKIKESLSTAGASAVIVLIVILIVWGAVAIIPRALSGMYNFFTASLSSTFAPAENLSVSADKSNIASGDTLNISINGITTDDNLFTLYYPCADGVSVELNGGNGATNAKINCGEDFYLLNKSGSFAITLNSDKARFVSVPLTVKSQNTDGVLQKIGAVNVGVTNQSFGVNTTNTAPENIGSNISTTNTVINTAPTYYGRPDLSVSITSVDTSNLYNTNVSDNVLVKFEVKNIGTNPSGQWKFNATLPSTSMPTYNSDLQRNLNPGDKIIFTLGFGSVSTMNGSQITINIDPNNAITESNESNNSANYVLAYNPPVVNPVYPNQYPYNTNGYNGYYYYNGQYYPNSYNYNLYNGTSDLTPVLVAVGTLDYNGQFAQTSQIIRGSTAIAKILVVNNGSSYSGPWNMVASFGPSYPTNSFQLTNQASLAPGERKEVLVTFVNVQQTGDNTFSILVDPSNQLNDTNRNNNSLTATLRVY